jgi:hypothetical protein
LISFGRLWFPARLIGVSQTFDVVYDDGEFEEAKPLDRVRPWSITPSSTLHTQGDSAKAIENSMVRISLAKNVRP